MVPTFTCATGMERGDPDPCTCRAAMKEKRGKPWRPGAGCGRRCWNSATTTGKPCASGCGADREDSSMSEARETSPGSSSPQRAAAWEPSALRQIRESAQALLGEGQVEEAFEFFLSALEAVLRKTRDLELLVAKLRREGVGKRSERIDPGQLQLLFEALCSQTSEGDPTAAIDPQAEAREDAELDQEIREAEQAQIAEKSPRKGHGRRIRTGTLQRQVHHHEGPEGERMCTQCGVAKERIGEDVTHTLEYVPGHFIEHEHHRSKYACGKCKEGVTTAPGPDKIIERSPAEASVLAQVVVSKIVDHCPLHRLHRIYKAQWSGPPGIDPVGVDGESGRPVPAAGGPADPEDSGRLPEPDGCHWSESARPGKPGEYRAGYDVVLCRRRAQRGVSLYSDG